MLAADDVIDLMGESRIFFVNQAVFATPGCAFADMKAQFRADSLPIGEVQSGTGFGHAEDMFQFEKVVEFDGFFRREMRGFLTFDEVRNSGLSFGRRMEFGDFLGRRASGYEVDKLRINGVLPHSCRFRILI